MTPSPSRGPPGRWSTLAGCPSRRCIRSSRPARWRGRSPTRCRRASARGRSSRCAWGAARPGAWWPTSASRRLRASSRSPVGRVLDEIPAPLVDLALWVADYYGSTPARALELVAPLRRAPRGERPSPAAARVARRASPSRDKLTDDQVPRSHGSSRRSTRASASTCCSTDRPAAARPRSTSRRARRRSSAGSGRSCSCPRSRSRRRRSAGSGSASATASRSSTPLSATRSGATSATGSRAARRGSSSARARRCSRRCAGLGLIVVDEEHDTAYKQESDPRYDARTVAAKRAALEGAVAVYGSATPRPESWARLRAHRARRADRRAAAAGRLVDLRREAGLPALGAAARGSSAAIVERGRQARSCSSTAAASRRRPLPGVRGLAPCPHCDVALTLHSRRTRSTATTAGAPSRSHARARRAARSSSPGSARAPSASRRSSRGSCRSSSGPPRRGHVARARAPCARRSSGSRGAERAVLVGTQMVAKGHDFPGVDARRRRRRRHGPRAAGLPRRGADVPAGHAACGPQRPRRARARARPDMPARRDAARVRRAATTSRGSSPASSSAARRSATRRSGISSRSRGRPRADAPLRCCASSGTRLGGRRRGPARAGAAPPPARAPPRAAVAKTTQPAPVARRAPGCSRRRLRRCGATVSRRSSTSIRSRCRTSSWTKH